MLVRATVPILLLALLGCAATAPKPADHSAHAGAGAPTEATAGKGGGMSGKMDEMCSMHAAEPGRAASAPDMMAKHCKARADAASGAASAVR